MKQYLGNILDVKRGVIAHQVNLFGVMGAGVAKLLADTHPELLEEYRQGCFGAELGDVHFFNTETENLTIANCFSQRKRYVRGSLTSYDAVLECFYRIVEKYPYEHIFVPFQYGCGIANGIWPIVKATLSHFENVILVCRPEDIKSYYEKFHPERDVNNVLKNMENLP